MSASLFVCDRAEFGAGLGGESIARIEAQEGLVDGFCLRGLVQVALEDFAFSEQGAEAKAAGGIFVAEKVILADGVVEGLLVLKDAAFFGEQVGDGGDGVIGFGRGGIAVVDGAVGVEDALVLGAGAIVFRAAFEGLAQTLGMGEGCRMRRAGQRRGRGDEQHHKDKAAHGMARILRGGRESMGKRLADRRARCIGLE